jgi:hypothetical protein
MYKVKNSITNEFVKEFKDVISGMIIEVFDEDDKPITDASGHLKFKVISNPKPSDFGLYFPVCTNRSNEDLCIELEPYQENKND